MAHAARRDAGEGSAIDADHLVHEALLRAWRSRERLREPASTRSWLYRVATNVCIYARRNDGRRGTGAR